MMIQFRSVLSGFRIDPVRAWSLSEERRRTESSGDFRSARARLGGGHTRSTENLCPQDLRISGGRPGEGGGHRHSTKMAASEPQTRPPESMDLEISMDSKPPTSPSKSPGSVVKEEGVRPPTRHALARAHQHDDYSDIHDHTTTTTFGIGEPFVARCLLKTRPLFFIRVGSGACQLPISGVSWVTGEWTRRGERDAPLGRRRAH